MRLQHPSGRWNIKKIGKPGKDLRKLSFMDVTGEDIRRALRELGLARQVVCLHSSLRSFGHVSGGAEAVVRAFLEEECTLLVPTFSSAFAIAPPLHLQFERNGWNYSSTPTQRHYSNRVYSPEVLDIDFDMGAIPAAVVAWPGRVRGNHPLDSFTAVGPHAAELVASQTPSDAYAPLRALIRLQGFVLLIGLGLERLTLLHLAEKEAGRILFRRWANDEYGQPMAVELGGCSEGFGRLEPSVRHLMRQTSVGQSSWIVLPAAQFLTQAAAAIRADPEITHCGVAECERCNDAIKGGPIVASD
jgi:aminoglycoside N3'-acetyltransferase